MTERPIIFTPEHVRKVLNGIKTQTRRIVKPQPIKQHHIAWVHDGGFGSGFQVLTNHAGTVERITCPYGKPGDKLWVQETWQQAFRASKSSTGVIYLADGPDFNSLAEQQHQLTRKERGWKPSIHMPKKFCRLWLEIVSIRVERVQEISEADAKAEGCLIPGILWPDITNRAYRYAAVFHLLWDSIHGAGAWERNDWVWVIEFKRL